MIKFIRYSYSSQETTMIMRFLHTFIMLVGMNVFLCAQAPVMQQEEFNKADEKKAFTFLKNTLNKSNGIAKKSSQTQKTKQKFARIMTNSFAIPHIAKFSLGREFRKYSAENFTKFERALSDYLLKVYATQEKIDVFASINIEDDDINNIPELSPRKNRLTYKAVFETKNGPINTQFVLIKTHNNHYKVFDIVVEGIGLLSNLRSQVSTLSVNKSIDNFVKDFAKKA